MNSNIRQLEVGKSISISLLLFTILYVFNLIQIEIYSIFSFISCIILLIDIFYIFRQEKWVLNPFLYLDIFLFFTTVFAPFFHFYSKSWLSYIYIHPEEWTPLANKLSALYLCCILILFFIRTIFDNKSPTRYYSTIYIANPKKLKYIYILMIISFLLQTYIYFDRGGVLGYIKSYGEEGFSGYGALFLISELFPLLFILLFYIKSRKKSSYSKWVTIYLFLFLLFVSCIYFGGLRGSRSNTLWTLFNAVLLIHFSVKKLGKNHLILIAILSFGFLYYGKIYKISRGDVILENNYSFQQELKGTDILAGDLSRYSMQAYIIYMYERNNDYNPKTGLTYIGDLLKFTPIDKELARQIDKVSAGTELLYGKNTLSRSSRVYGILGESMLNFGIMLSPIIFVLFSIIVTKIKKNNEKISTVSDLRFFLIPILINFVIVMFNSDLDNVFFFFIKRILPMILMILLIKKRCVIADSTNGRLGKQ